MPRGVSVTSVTASASSVAKNLAAVVPESFVSTLHDTSHSLVSKAVVPRIPRRTPPWAPLGEALKRHWSDFAVHACTVQAAGAHPSEKHPLLYWSEFHPRQPEVLHPQLFFRSLEEMPPLERRAMELCRNRGGRVLDIGAGAGSHALALADMGLEVDAIDVDPLAVDVMHQRGVTHARECCLWKLHDLRPFKTVLLLMNSIGVVENVEHLRSFLDWVHSSSSSECGIVLDISPPDWADVVKAAHRRDKPLSSSKYRDREWVTLKCWLTLGPLSGKPFSMLFLEVSTLAAVARSTGWTATLLFEDDQTRHALLLLEKAPEQSHSVAKQSFDDVSERSPSSRASFRR